MRVCVVFECVLSVFCVLFVCVVCDVSFGLGKMSHCPAVLLPLAPLQAPCQCRLLLLERLRLFPPVMAPPFSPPLPVLEPPAGASPTQAVLLLERLRLFPAVFTPPPQNEKQLGDGFGTACSSAMAGAAALLKASGLEEQVRFRGWV